MIKLASIIAASSVLAFLASSPTQSPDQTAEPASTQETVTDQSDAAADQTKTADQSPSLSEALLSVPSAGKNPNRSFRDPDLGRAALRDPLGRPHRSAVDKFTPELIEQCLEVAREVKPQLAARLERLRRDSTEVQFEQALRRRARYLISLVHLRDRNPGLYDLKLREFRTSEQIQQITLQLHEALNTGSTGQIEPLKIELHDLVALQASQSIEAHARYLLRIKEHMEALEQQIEAEGSNFQQTVEQRFQEILDRIKSSSPNSTEPTSG